MARSSAVKPLSSRPAARRRCSALTYMSRPRTKSRARSPLERLSSSAPQSHSRTLSTAAFESSKRSICSTGKPPSRSESRRSWSILPSRSSRPSSSPLAISMNARLPPGTLSSSTRPNFVSSALADWSAVEDEAIAISAPTRRSAPKTSGTSSNRSRMRAVEEALVSTTLCAPRGDRCSDGHSSHRPIHSVWSKSKTARMRSAASGATIGAMSSANAATLASKSAVLHDASAFSQRSSRLPLAAA
mmetsp:Transcript_25484/g.81775  ORF Transcript_25484/g.81775 Transcript_25484/m.81775 type:complete len:245 (-) Transcript_25484:163-897(-)